MSAAARELRPPPRLHPARASGRSMRMGTLKILFVGGTGLISAACTDLALERGIEVFHLNRGSHPSDKPRVTTLLADIHDEATVEEALAGRRFDAVVDWVAYRPDDIERDVRLFRDRTRQYVFISSASVYQKPLRGWPIREDWPLSNPYWQYARDKIASEDRVNRAFREEGLPVTIVRPSHTYGEQSIPLAVRSLTRPFTSIARMRAGRAVIVPGDGSSLWTLTHRRDFAVGLVGLLGLPQAFGHAFNIMSDEALSWDEIYRQTAAAAGAELRPVHVTSEFIAACMPEISGRLLGDGSESSVFDTSKLRKLVPDFRPSVPFSEGIRRAVHWFDTDPARQEIDPVADARWDRLIAAWERGLGQAQHEFESMESAR
jgi:nucleoside-diphosphate-sugar epimerase